MTPTLIVLKSKTGELVVKVNHEWLSKQKVGDIVKFPTQLGGDQYIILSILKIEIKDISWSFFCKK